MIPRDTSASTYEIFRYEQSTKLFFCFKIRETFEIQASGSAGCTRPNFPHFAFFHASVSVLVCLVVEASLISCAFCAFTKVYFITFLFINMDWKKVSVKVSAQKKMMSIELKCEIIEKHEQGLLVTDLTRQYKRSAPTICTVLKQKELIKGVTQAKSIKRITKLQTFSMKRWKNC